MQNSKNSECGLHLYTHTKMWLIASSLTSTQLIYVAQIEQKKKKKKKRSFDMSIVLFFSRTLPLFWRSSFRFLVRPRLALRKGLDWIACSSFLLFFVHLLSSVIFSINILDIIWTSEVAVGVDLFDVFIKQSLAVCNQVMVLLLS